ncbi:S41 family peptidase [Clostridium sp. BJN0001]|uniref:S41 family peptidase n=1 Tax=Clostridium sp. BJN0001 TaxID=2930219 RepID=UPI001FCF8083|nr:S41 family peptidase [Clostridium sp. BJN0001]
MKNIVKDKLSEKAKSRIIDIIIGISIVICSLLCFFAGNYMGSKGIFLVKTTPKVVNDITMSNSAANYKALFEVRSKLLEKYYSDIDDNKLLEGAIKGMTNAVGDKYTKFYNKEEMDEFLNESKASFEGIGIEVTATDNNEVEIADIIEDSPASEADIQKGDILLKVDDNDVTADTFDDTTKIIRSAAEEKKPVSVKLKRNESIVDTDVDTAVVKVSSVDGKMINENVGYIRIKTFINERTSIDFENEIKYLKEDGMKGLILDLRENPGGLLDEAVGVASQFIPKGDTITYTVDKYNNKDISVSEGGIAQKMPLVLLVNENSASASEVVTGALRDYKAATIIGKNTFGKGIVQMTYKFLDGIGGLKVTVSKYYTPNGENIHEIGIKPDIEVDSDERVSDVSYNSDNDEQMKKAIEKIEENID